MAVDLVARVMVVLAVQVGEIPIDLGVARRPCLVRRLEALPVLDVA